MDDKQMLAEIADMKSIKGEYVRQMSYVIADGMADVMEIIKGRGEKTLQDIILQTAVKCYEISNADFEDNSNPDHAKEQGGYANVPPPSRPF